MAFGRFERLPAQRPMSEINVTPLVDVMMVLLVIFIITAPLMIGHLPLDLPKVEGAQASAPPRAVRLAIDAKARVYLEGQATDDADLARALAQRAQASGGDSLPELQLQADERVPYGRVAEIMGLAQQAGLTRIAFVTERRAPAAARPAKP